jgi:FkbM family methyltransferase
MFVPSNRRNVVRNALRYMAWRLGDGMAEVLSRLRRFRLPDDALQPYAQKIPMLLGRYEPETQRLMRSLLRPGDIVVDGGAHAGYYTRLFSRAVGPGGRVLAFEVHPQTVELLRSNVAGHSNVEILGVALGSTDGEVTLFEQPTSSAGHSVAPHKPGLVASHAVPMRSLPSVLRECGLERFDLLKLDIEGSEPDVLATLEQIDGLSDFSVIFEIKRYILEPHGITPEGLLRSYLDKGFHAWIVGGKALTTADLETTNPRLDKANILLMKGRAVLRLPQRQLERA